MKPGGARLLHPRDGERVSRYSHDMASTRHVPDDDDVARRASLEIRTNRYSLMATSAAKCW